MFQLLYDRRHNVLMTRCSGTYVLDDITVRDRAVARFVARHGLARGIMDFTEVDAVDLPMSAIVKRASEPPLLPGQMRVIVAPHDLTYGLTRVMAAHQLFNRNVEPLLVRTLDEGYRLLGLVDPQFEPIEEDDATVLDGTMARALAQIDAGSGGLRSADADRLALREKMLRLLDTVLLRTAAQPLREPQIITLSDVLNAALASARVTDGDIKAACRDCRKALSLSACRVVASRETSYLCPSCRSVLVVLAPVPEGVPPEPEDGYPLGSFLVRPLVDLECRGARLPECSGALRASRPAAGRTG